MSIETYLLNIITTLFLNKANYKTIIWCTLYHHIYFILKCFKSICSMFCFTLTETTPSVAVRHDVGARHVMFTQASLPCSAPRAVIIFTGRGEGHPGYWPREEPLKRVCRGQLLGLKTFTTSAYLQGNNSTCSVTHRHILVSYGDRNKNPCSGIWETC